MEENAKKIQSVLVTLEQLNIKATYENMDKLLGCMQTLISVRDWLRGEADNGNNRAE